MEPVRILIVDDEPLARKRLNRLIASRPDVRLAGECRNGREAVSAILEGAVDLVFLDIQMPDLDGFGVIESVGIDHMPVVVFVTAYDTYALSAFEAHALDYLLKPFEDGRFDQALDRALAQINQRRLGDAKQLLHRLLGDMKDSNTAGTKPADRLPVHDRDRVYFVPVADIDWIEADGPYVRVHTGKESHHIRDSLKRLCTVLDPRQIVRIHRSTMINANRVKELYPRPHGEYDVALYSGVVLRLSRGYRAKAAPILGL